MKTFTKNLIIIALLISIVNVAVADRGVIKKNKNKTVLNIATNSFSIRNSIINNYRLGLSYRGNLLTRTNTVGTSLIAHSVLTYQKGNMTYIIPYKQKIIISDIKQGYTGMKLIIRPR